MRKFPWRIPKVLPLIRQTNYKAELHCISVEEGVPHYAAIIGEVEEFRKEANGYFQKINDGAKGKPKNSGIELTMSTDPHSHMGRHTPQSPRITA